MDKANRPNVMISGSTVW